MSKVVSKSCSCFVEARRSTWIHLDPIALGDGNTADFLCNLRLKPFIRDLVRGLRDRMDHACMPQRLELLDMLCPKGTTEYA